MADVIKNAISTVNFSNGSDKNIENSERLIYKQSLTKWNAISRFEAVLKSLKIPRENWGKFTIAIGQELLDRKPVEEKTLNLPKVPPRTYEKRLKGAHKDIVMFLTDVWGPWLSTGSITQADLYKLDKKAYIALQNYQRKHTLPAWLRAALPRKSDLHDQMLKRIPHLAQDLFDDTQASADVPDALDRKRLTDVVRKRKRAKRIQTENSM